MLSQIGLMIVIVAWLIQYISLTKKSGKISPMFLIFYGVGISFLVIDGFNNGLRELSYLNTIALVAALLVYTKTPKK